MSRSAARPCGSSSCRLIAVALPTIRDFRGMSPKLDGQGNYTIGITDHTIFPEITVDNVKKHIGVDITIVTSANTDDEARDLLRLLGMPFRRAEGPAKPTHHQGRLTHFTIFD